MAARLNPRHAEMIREKIRASQLVNRLEDHVFGENDVDLTASQVTAALGLLKKCVPDITESKTEIETGESLTALLVRIGSGRSDPPVA
jgi:hypothetical protein